MRILYIRNLNQVAETDGGELRRRGHSVRVYEPNLAGKDAALPIKLLKMPARVLSLRDIVDELNFNSFDIIHIHWANYGVLGLMSQIPFIVECHGSDVRYHLKHPFFRSILTPVFHRAAAVLCITPDLLPIVRTVRSDAVFFPGPIDTHRFRPEEDTHSCSSRPWTILLFTRLDPIKGTEIAMQGIVQFTERHKGVRVQLLDWGLLKADYKHRYGGHFEFIPYIAPEQVQHLICSADVVVGQFNLGILSFCELQAMSCAKPLICSFGYEEAYFTLPPLCSASTPNEIDEHLENLFQNPEVGATIGQNARKWIIKNHDYRDRAARLEAHYQSIIQASLRKNGKLQIVESLRKD